MQVGSSVLTVAAVAPQAFTTTGATVTGTAKVLTVTGGSGLKLMATSGDAAKMVTSSGSCSDSSAGGSIEVADLGPNDAVVATQATMTFRFSIAGDYKLCYKLAGGSYVQVGSSVLTVAAVPPQAFSNDGVMTTGGDETITFTGGSGLKLMATSGDMTKVVLSSGGCSDVAARGTKEVTDLGPDNSNGATLAITAFKFTLAGTYKVCYRTVGGSYVQVGSSLIVMGSPPTSFKDDGQSSTGGRETITLTGGTGLDRSNGGDTAKMVLGSDTCAYQTAGGTSEVTDLGPDDSKAATNVTATFIVTIAGTYKLCYKVFGGAYTQIGTKQWTVLGVNPTSFRDDGNVHTSDSGVTEFIDLWGGSGMNLQSGKDMLKVVDWHDSCSEGARPAWGSTEVTDLGNDDATDATRAVASFSFQGAGSFKVCYKLSGGNYTQVGTELLTVTTNSTPDSSYREISQNVSFGTLVNCHFWTGDVEGLFTLGYASSIGVFAGESSIEPLLFDHYMHSTCREYSPWPLVTFTLTVQAAKVQYLKGRMASLDAFAIWNNISRINSTFPRTRVQMIPIQSIAVFKPSFVHAKSYSVTPMIWVGDGSLSIGSNESFTLLQAFGLRLGPGQDAMKETTQMHNDSKNISLLAATPYTSF